MKNISKTAKRTAYVLIACFILNILPLMSAQASEAGVKYTNIDDFNAGNLYSIKNVEKEVVESLDEFSPQFNELLDIFVEINYYELDRDEAIKMMLKKFFSNYSEMYPYLADSLVSSVDNFSGYYPLSNMEDIFGGVNYTGFGFMQEAVEYIDGFGYGLKLKNVFKDSPAEFAGVKKGDILIEIDGFNVESLGFNAIADILRSKNGETKLVFARNSSGTQEKKIFYLKKQTVTRSAVSVDIIDEKTAMITISDFMNEYFLDDYYEAITYLKDANIENIIFDLRNNGGGSVEYALNAVNLLVTEEDVNLMKLLYRDGAEEYYQSNGTGFRFNKISVLVNGSTASSSEYFTIAVRDILGAVVIGEKTYGKGIGQYYHEFENGDTASITVMELQSPKGTAYHKKGIVPDIDLPMSTKTVDALENIEPLNFVNAKNIKAGADDKAVLALTQRFALIGYIKRSEITSVMNDKIITLIKLFQAQYGLKVNANIIDYDFVTILNYLSSYPVTSQVDGDVQLECAKVACANGAVAASDYAKKIKANITEVTVQE